MWLNGLVLSSLTWGKGYSSTLEPVGPLVTSLTWGKGYSSTLREGIGPGWRCQKGARADLSPKSDFLIKRYKRKKPFFEGGKNGGKRGQG